MILCDNDGNPLPKAEFRSRFIPNDTIIIDDVKLTLQRSLENNNNENLNGTFYEHVTLVCEIPCDDWQVAIKNGMPYIEWVCDQLAYFSQEPVLITSSKIHKKDDDAEFTLFPKPKQPAKFTQTTFCNNRFMPPITILIKKPDHFNEKDLAVIRWYHKSLASNYDIDRFLFLWVCLEILCKINNHNIKEPYRTSCCNHVIDTCPKCGKPTERIVNGKSIKKYLTNELNVPIDISSKLWRFRQIIHGEVHLTDESTSDMGNLIMELQAAVSLGLKRRFGIPDDQPPIVIAKGVQNQAMGLSVRKA